MLFLFSVALALLLSAAFVMLVNVAVAASLNHRGINALIGAPVIVFTGNLLPLSLFPDWAHTALLLQPFAGLLDIPLRIYLGSARGLECARGPGHPGLLDRHARRARQRVDRSRAPRSRNAGRLAMSDLRLLLRFISASLRAQAQYPGSAIMLTLGQLFATVIEILAVWALFHRFGDVHGWRFGEVAVFYGLVNMMFALADMITRGFDVLGTEFLRTGEFDRVLLRPRAATLQLIGYEFRISRLGRFAQGVAVLVIGSQLIGLHWGIAEIAMAIWAVAGGRGAVLRRADAAGHDVVLDHREPRSRERRHLRRSAGRAVPAEPLRQAVSRISDVHRAARVRRVLPGARRPRQARSTGHACVVRCRRSRSPGFYFCGLRWARGESAFATTLRRAVSG